MRGLSDSLDWLRSRLSHREQRLLALLAILALGGVSYLGVLGPISNNRARLASRTVSLANELPALENMAQAIIKLEAELGKAPAVAGNDVTLLAFVERAASSAVGREAVESMNPNHRKLDDGTAESTVELRLVAVGLDRLITFLAKIDAGLPAVHVKRLELKRRYQEDASFDVLITIGRTESA